MKVSLLRRDLVVLLCVAATAAFAVSLGVDPALAVELVVGAGLLLFVAVLLREEPPPAPRRPPAAGEDAATLARRAIDSALASPWGARGRFRRVVRAAVIARLAREGLDLDDVRGELPTELLALLDGDWHHDRGLTAAELDRILTTTERLDP